MQKEYLMKTPSIKAIIVIVLCFLLAIYLIENVLTKNVPISPDFSKMDPR